ncbi:MAG: chloride channel protein [Planctomycetota bacterium]|nr:MAG: chloride channel protein [Planctomycetota bacterium]
MKVAASVLTVGSGGSAGTEGPIVQIGAVIGSVGGQWLRVSREQMQTLVGCGAAAGIASVFNAPIAGVFFVLEILLRDFSLRTFTPIVVSSVFSAVATQRLLGENEAIFTVDHAVHDYQFAPIELPTYIMLGAVCGLVAVLFNRLLHKGEDLYEKVRIHPLLKPVTGGLALGLLGVVYIFAEKALFPDALNGQTVPPFYGNGYSTIHTLLDPESYRSELAQGPGVMLLLAGVFVAAGRAQGGGDDVHAGLGRVGRRVRPEPVPGRPPPGPRSGSCSRRCRWCRRAPRPPATRWWGWRRSSRARRMRHSRRS